MNSLSLFIFNIFINSFLTFFTVLIITESLIAVLKLPAGRWRAVLRMIPILKLPLDLFFYDFTRWAYLNGVDPLANEGARKLSLLCGYGATFQPVLTRIEFTVLDHTFTLADLIASWTGPFFVNTLSCVLVSLLLYALFSKVRSYLKLNTDLKTFKKKCFRVEHLDTSIKIYSADAKLSPFVMGFSSDIFIPQKLLAELSQNELEAVILHEKNHIRCKDAALRTVLDFIETLFFWIPTRWSKAKIQLDQEISCDEFAAKRCERLTLASALVKSAHYRPFSPAYVQFTENPLKIRFDQLINHNPTPQKILPLIICSLVVLVLAFNKLWIF